MPKKCFVVGVGLTKFEKPGKREWDYPQMAEEAGKKALADAGISYEAIQQAVVGYCYGDSTCGQRAVYTLGLTGIPIYNVNNNCSTGSTALLMGKQFIEGDLAECVLALGFEKMERGSLKNKWNDRTVPLDKHVMAMLSKHQMTRAPMAPQLFGNAGKEHMERYGTRPEHFARIAEKNHRHSKHNPYSQFRDEYTLDQIMASPQVHDPLTKLQCCPTSEGAAAAVLCSEDFVRRHNLQDRAVEIVAMEMATDMPGTFGQNMMETVGTGMTRKAAELCYRKSGLSPKDVQVVELHDCFSCNELITYEALGLCGEGQAAEFVDRGENTYGGKYVVNPSGGLISKGHPLGATGIAQCAELAWQLRGQCGARQVPNAKVALQHNIGLGGAAVVGLYRLGFPEAVRPPPPGAPNPAVDEVSANARPAPAGTSSAAPGMQADMVFAELGKRVNAEMVKQVGATYRFTITGKSGAAKSWLVDLKTGSGSVKVDAKSPADTTIEASDADFVGLMTGKADPQELFFAGKLKVSGDMSNAMKLSVLSGQASKL